MNFALVILISHVSRNYATDIGYIGAGEDPGDVQFHPVVILLDHRFLGYGSFRLLCGEGEGRHAGQRQQGKSFHWMFPECFEA
ncbi:hypothetical protein D9M68_921010 [compost metagenome]